MLLSHDHRFIFIKTRKTASTSIEISVSRFLRNQADVITPIAEEDEITRWRHRVKPQNWEVPGEPTNAKYFNHMSALEVSKLVPVAWLEYFTFCFERNPWDKCVSMYYWLLQTRPGMGFKEWIMDPEAELPINWGLYTIDDEVVVDMVFRWEDLPGALLMAQNRGETPPEGEVLNAYWFDGWLPNAKSRFRPPNTPYQALYDNKTRERVAHAFAEEIQCWGYTFDDEKTDREELDGPATPGG